MNHCEKCGALSDGPLCPEHFLEQQERAKQVNALALQTLVDLGVPVADASTAQVYAEIS